MPITLREVSEHYIAALQEIASATERAQSERVGPSILGLQDWYRAEVRPVRMADMYPDRYVATAATIRASNEAGPPITAQMLDDLTRRFSARQPESAPRAQGGRMRFSAKHTPLNDVEKTKMKTFFTQVLRDGKASYPLTSNRLIIFSDGVGKFIYRDNRWSMTSDYVYIGYVSDEGIGELSDPAARLALTVALMALCDLQNDSELLQLVEQRLAKVLAGVYEGAIAPLAERTNGEPVSRIAWSTTGGVAAFVDGQWTSPVTGEAVAVGEGWVVVETGEGRKTTQSTNETLSSDQTFVWTEERFSQLIQLEGWNSVGHLLDGRSWEYYSPIPTGCQEEIIRLERAGYPGLILAQHADGRWGITYPLPSSPAQEVEPMPF